MRDARAFEPDRTEGPSSGFSGSCQNTSLADWLQLIQLGRRDAIVIVRTPDQREGRLWCQAGDVVDARWEGLAGEDAVYRILSLESGRVTVDFTPFVRPRTIHLSTTGLLLEAACRKDTDALEAAPRTPVSSPMPHDAVSVSDPGRAPGGGGTMPGLAPPVGTPSGGTPPVGTPPGGTLAGGTPPGGTAHGSMPRGIPPADTPHGGTAFGGASPAVGSSSGAGTSTAPHAHPTLPAPEESPARGRARWVWLTAFAAAVLITFWLSARIGPDPAPSVPVVASARPPAPDPEGFLVHVDAQPEQAEIRLDGEIVAKRTLITRLPRDGRLHEMVVAAVGYVPQVVTFRDRAPPPRVALERVTSEHPPLERAPVERATPERATPIADPPRAHGEEVPPARARRSLVARSVPEPPPQVNTGPSPASSSPSTALAPPPKPKIQIIDERQPWVQPIDDSQPRIKAIE